ncbi:MAG TPA: SPOR domain-containing protein [Rhizomicrobium sp.]
MAHLERDTYEPANIDSFDSGDDIDTFDEGSRLPLLIVIALIVLAAFAGVVWLAYTQGVERGRADAPRMVAAEPPSVIPKTQPLPYTGLKIYQQPSAAAGETDNAGGASTDSVASRPPPPPRLALPRTSSAPPPLRPSASATPEAPAARPAIPPAVQPKPAEPAPPSSQGGAAPAEVATHATAPASSSTFAAHAAAGPGSIFLQIGSYKSDAEARRSWVGFKARHGIAAGYQPDIRKAELGAKGSWYRLRLGSFPDRQAAAAFCEKLRSDGASCLLAR